MADPAQRFIAIDGVTLHVRCVGAGDPVILLHGFPEHWRSWQHQLPALAGAGFEAWAPDLRGYNLSGRPLERSAYTLERLTADVAGLVHATGHPRAHIVGHDWGGVIAWAFAATYPDLTHRLAICNAPHPGLYPRTLRSPDQFVRSWYVSLFLVPGLAERLLSAFDFRPLRRMFTRGPATPGTFTAADVAAYVDAMRPPGALTAALEYYRANAGLRTATSRTWPMVQAETLVIWGERDPALSLVQLEHLDTVARHVRVHRLPGVSHWVQNEAPAEVNRLLVEFLAGVGR